ncbi:hypothetical protein [Pseudobacteroides cellulosolvens]|nr:hypothetical protein [Pseudobacteroides cellulosolvens]
MQQSNRIKGMQIHEIHPILFGCDPTDPENKTLLTRKQHAEVVTWWNRKLKELKQEMGD